MTALIIVRTIFLISFHFNAVIIRSSFIIIVVVVVSKEQKKAGKKSLLNKSFHYKSVWQLTLSTSSCSILKFPLRPQELERKIKVFYKLRRKKIGTA
jgi:hypothetical protein